MDRAFHPRTRTQAVDWASRSVSGHTDGSVLLPVKQDLGPCCCLGTERARPPPARRCRTAVARLTSAGLQRAGSSPRLGRSATAEPDLEDSSTTMSGRNGRSVAAYGQCVDYIFHRMFIEGGEDGGNIMDIWCKKNINILFT